LLFDRQYLSKDLNYGNVTKHVLRPRTRHPVFWLFWFEWAVRNKLKSLKPDVFFSPEGFGQLSTKMSSVVLLHDINFVHFPKYLSLAHRLFYNTFFPLYAKKAKRVITVSEFCKNDISETWKIPREKIQVVYNGGRELKHMGSGVNFYPETPYFLYIGSVTPRKNLINQIKAFELYKKETNAPDQFIIAGESRWGEKVIAAVKKSPYSKHIKILGRVTDRDYFTLLKHAKALMYVSVFEGFGLPVVEAMSMGVPVITSNTSSLPEISGDASLMADPKNPDDIKSHMLSLRDSVFVKEMIKKGYKRASLFSWDLSAQKTWGVLEQVFQETC